MKIDQMINTSSMNDNIWILRNPFYYHQQQVTDSPINSVSRKNKSNENDNCHQLKSCENMKSMISSKHVNSNYSDIDRNNIYVETPPKIKSILINDKNHYTPIIQQRQRPISIRTDSSRSIDNFSSPSNSFRHDSKPIITNSSDASSSCGLITQTKTNSNHIKTKAIYDLEKSIFNNNSKCLNMITNGNFFPLQSVKEDEYLQINNKYSKNDNEYLRQYISSSSNVSTPIMPRNNSSHQRSLSTDEESLIENTNGFTRNNRIRSSLPFIIKPAVNTSRSNSLGLCFLICGNETKKVLLPSYISCMDTLKALFVRAFPQHLTMKQMDTDHIRIYIRESEKDIFYQLEDISDVKDRSVLKIVQLNNNNNNNNNNKPHVSFKQPEIDETLHSLLDNNISYQRLSRFGRILTTNGSNEDKSTLHLSDNSSRSLSEPRRRIDNNETIPIKPQTSTVLKGILSSPRSGSTTPTTSRLTDDDARTKMALMEKQLESLTELVKKLTNSKHTGNLTNINNKSLDKQLDELKLKTHTLHNDLISIRHMQQSLQENFKIELEEANKKIQEQFLHLNQNIENEFDLYIKKSIKIDQDLEDLEILVEELQNDVKSKQCYVTMNDVESFALVLSTISRSLVDLKASFPILRDKLSSLDQQTTIKFLYEEPERLDYTIKKCKRLTIMLYQLKRLVINQENKLPRKILFEINNKSIDRKRLLEEIHSVTSNSDGRIKAIEKAEKLRERRLYYENQLENLKQMKTTSDQIESNFDNRSLTNSLSTRTSICSTDSNNCPSPSLSFIIHQALISSTPNNFKTSIKPPSKVTFSQQLITNEKSLTKTNIYLNKKSKPTPPPRIQNTPPPSSSSSAVSSASSSSSSSTNGNSRLTNTFCGILPLLSSDRRLNGRCYSFSSSSTDTDSVISNSQKVSSIKKPHQTTSMRASVTDL